MQHWQEARLDALKRAENEAAIFRIVTDMAADLGFRYCGFGMRMPLPISQPKVYTINNFSPTWQTRYVVEDYIAAGPTVNQGSRSVMLLIWSDQVFAPAQALWRDAKAHGLQVGWAQSCHDARGVGALLTLARPDGDMSETELDANLPKMTWLVQAVHASMARVLVPKLMPEAASELSGRELEVLRWTGDGKTSSEIGDILSLSEHTVNFHIKNSLIKLNATNKTAGVVKAVMMGLL